MAATVFILVGLPILVYIIKGTIDDVFFKDTCVLVEGTITKIEEREESNMDETRATPTDTVYYFTIKFVTIKEQTIESEFSEARFTTKQVGDKVKIYYLPSDPSIFSVDTTMNSRDIFVKFLIKLILFALISSLICDPANN